MAKITYRNGSEQIFTYYEGLTLDEMHSSSKLLTYNADEGAEIVIKGKGLGVDNHGIIDEGRVTEVDFLDGSLSHKALLTVKLGANEPPIEGVSLHHALSLHDSTDLYYAFVQQLLVGNDRIKGSPQSEILNGGLGSDHIDGGKGDDLIAAGGGGHDVCRGGGGSDTFYFSSGAGFEKILDFDADGGEGHQDFIGVNHEDDHHKIIKDGHDTIIRFGDDAELLLVGVDSKHVSSADFRYLD